MIDPKSRSREWILESCEKNKVKDPTLMEKTIRAFSLLEALTKSGCKMALSRRCGIIKSKPSGPATAEIRGLDRFYYDSFSSCL